MTSANNTNFRSFQCINDDSVVAPHADMRMLSLAKRIVAFILTLVYIDTFRYKHYRMNTKMDSIDTPKFVTQHV